MLTNCVTRVMPSHFVEVNKPFKYGGRDLRQSEKLWMTESDFAAYQSSVRLIRIVSSNRIEQRIREVFQ
jgi:hypothetical protein